MTLSVGNVLAKLKQTYNLMSETGQYRANTNVPPTLEEGEMFRQFEVVSIDGPQGYEPFQITVKVVK